VHCRGEERCHEIGGEREQRGYDEQGRRVRHASILTGEAAMVR
jgi:hypothetical protein